MSTVFVVQKQFTVAPETGQLMPKYDLTSAEKFGQLVYLLGPTAGPFSGQSIIPELKEKLACFDPEADYLLLIGNPCLIGWVSAVAAQKTGRLRFLQWSSKNKQYVPIESNILAD